MCELLCDVRFPEPVRPRRYIDLVTDRKSEECLPNSDRHKRIVCPPNRAEAVRYRTVWQSEGNECRWILNRGKAAGAKNTPRITLPFLGYEWVELYLQLLICSDDAESDILPWFIYIYCSYAGQLGQNLHLVNSQENDFRIICVCVLTGECKSTGINTWRLFCLELWRLKWTHASLQES